MTLPGVAVLDFVEMRPTGERATNRSHQHDADAEMHPITHKVLLFTGYGEVTARDEVQITTCSNSMTCQDLGTSSLTTGNLANHWAW